MSKQVDFYLISNQVSQAKYKLASRLSNKLLKLDKKTLIVTDNAETTAEIDELLWSFSGTSFVAHERVGDKDNSQSNIHIGDATTINPEALEKNYDVLINLSKDVPVFIHHFTRIAEIIEQDEAEKEQGRARYKSYKEQGFELKTHPIEL